MRNNVMHISYEYDIPPYMYDMYNTNTCTNAMRSRVCCRPSLHASAYCKPQTPDNMLGENVPVHPYELGCRLVSPARNRMRAAASGRCELTTRYQALVLLNVDPSTRESKVVIGVRVTCSYSHWHQKRCAERGFEDPAFVLLA